MECTILMIHADFPPSPFVPVGLKAQEVKSPRRQIHIQTCRLHLVAISLERLAAEYIREMPRSSAQVVPGQLNATLRLVLREVHDDQVTLQVLLPAPCYQVQVAAVVGPTRACAQLPCALPQSRCLNRCQQFVVERSQIRINRFDRSAHEENRGSHSPSLALALVQEFRS